MSAPIGWAIWESFRSSTKRRHPGMMIGPYLTLGEATARQADFIATHNPDPNSPFGSDFTLVALHPVLPEGGQ